MRRTLTFVSLLTAFSLFAACASTDWEGKYLEQQEASRQFQDENDSLTQKMAEQEALKEEARRELDQTRAAVAGLSERIQEVKNRPLPAAEPVPAPPANDEEMERLQAELARLKAKYGDDVDLTPEGNIEITLNSDVTFSSGSKTLTPKGKQVLDSVAAELQREFAGHAVRVVGHTDSDPIRKSKFDDNWQLGAERALVVTRYFETQHGIEAGRLIAASRGSNAPVADNQTKAGKSRNRRVEIVVVIPRKQILGDHSAMK